MGSWPPDKVGRLPLLVSLLGSLVLVAAACGSSGPATAVPSGSGSAGPAGSSSGQAPGSNPSTSSSPLGSAANGAPSLAAGSSAPGSSAPAAPGATPTAGRTPAPTPKSTGSSAGPDLVAMLPTKVAGIPLTRQKSTGKAIIASTGSCFLFCPIEVSALTKAAGAQPADLALAWAMPTSPDLRSWSLEIRAARIRGAHDVLGKWEQVLVDIQGPGPVLTWTTVTIGGKKVAKQLRDAMDPAVTSGTGRYFYVSGDTVFDIILFPQPGVPAVEALLGEVLSQLP